MASQVRIAHTHRVTIPRYHCMTADLLSVLCVSKNHIPLHFGSLTPVQCLWPSLYLSVIACTASVAAHAQKQARSSERMRKPPADQLVPY